MSSNQQVSAAASKTIKDIHMQPISINHPKHQDLLVERAEETVLRSIFDKVALLLAFIEMLNVCVYNSIFKVCHSNNPQSKGHQVFRLDSKLFGSFIR
jgi:hypothetical protein